MLALQAPEDAEDMFRAVLEYATESRGTPDSATAGEVQLGDVASFVGDYVPVEDLQRLCFSLEAL